MDSGKEQETLAKMQAKLNNYEASQQPVKLSRAERRRQERNKKKFDQIKTFTKAEVESMNEQAYKYGVAFALVAAKEVLQLGETRLDRIRKRITEFEFEYFTQLKPFHADIDETLKYKGGASKNGK